MHTYQVSIHWSSAADALIAAVTELPGCAADGPTRTAALKNVDVIIKEWIETAKSLGRTIPEPKGRLVFA